MDESYHMINPKNMIKNDGLNRLALKPIKIRVLNTATMASVLFITRFFVITIFLILQPLDLSVLSQVTAVIACVWKWSVG